MVELFELEICILNVCDCVFEIECEIFVCLCCVVLDRVV